MKLKPWDVRIRHDLGRWGDEYQTLQVWTATKAAARESAIGYLADEGKRDSVILSIVAGQEA